MIDSLCQLPYIAVTKFHGLMSFLSFPEKPSRLPVTLPILGTLDSNIHIKTFAVTKQSTKTAKIFHSETKAIYGILFNCDEVSPLKSEHG